MDRVTFRLPTGLLEQVEEIVEEEEDYKDRSEALREAARDWVQDYEVEVDPHEGQTWTTVRPRGDD